MREKTNGYRPYLEPVESVIEYCGSTAAGLDQEEAEARLAADGENKLTEPEKESRLKKFLGQMKDPMIIVLLAAAALSLFTSIYEGESFADVFIILFVVILNSVLGVLQESKAEEAIAALKKMTAPESKVMRGGRTKTVKSEELVIGDIIILEAGDSVPADARLIESASMKIEESALTGESVPVTKQTVALSTGDGEKDISLGDRKNMVYMGSTVVYGRGMAVITATGMNTEMGHIADAISGVEDEMTPLQRKLSQLSKILTAAVLGICIIIFVLGVVKAGSFTADVLVDTFMLAISLAVAAIPEGLAAVVTIVLSIGVTRMSQRNAVIRRLTAVETLGCAQIICSDKTGTLTQNKMTVTDHFGADADLLAAGTALASDAEQMMKDGREEISGEPTEAALVAYASSRNLFKSELEKLYPRIGEAPFDSGRKMMSTVHRNAGLSALCKSAANGAAACSSSPAAVFEDSAFSIGADGVGNSGLSEDSFLAAKLFHNAKYIQFTKGAPDIVLKRCCKMLTMLGVLDITEDLRKEILEANANMAGRALRVLSLAAKCYDEVPKDFSSDALEDDMVFIGLVGMIDPIRPEVKQAVEECREAGIRPVMITGDQFDTAVAIGKELGILNNRDEAMLGAQLDDMSDEELAAAVGTYSVYARVQPEHKVRIVRAWKSRQMVTAMTGDGVNDAPAIKTADIGIGMGITGTDVTKGVADMILVDDNFATIVAAVEEGRRVYANIRKAVQFLLSSNISEVLAILAATLMGFVILKPAHILWINLITDSLPALALGLEACEKDAMRKKPRRSDEGIFAGGMGGDILYQGAFVTILVLAAYVSGHYMQYGVFEFTDSPQGITMAFMTMSMAEIFQSFNMRSQRKSIFGIGKPNKWLRLSAVIAMLLTTTVVAVKPVADLFSFTEITIAEYFVAMGFAIAIIPMVEAIKALQRAFSSHRRKSD